MVEAGAEALWATMSRGSIRKNKTWGEEVSVQTADIFRHYARICLEAALGEPGDE